MLLKRLTNKKEHGIFCVNDLNAIMDRCVTASWIVDTCLTAQTPNLRQSYETESNLHWEKGGTVKEKGSDLLQRQNTTNHITTFCSQPQNSKKILKYLQETQSDLSNYKCFSPVTYSHSPQRCYFAAAEKQQSIFSLTIGNHEGLGQKWNKITLFGNKSTDCTVWFSCVQKIACPWMNWIKKT